MILSKTPFRVSFAGGGSDLPDFFRKYGGAVLSTTIDKHIYISVYENFNDGEILLKYSKTERVKDASKIKHTIAKSVLSEMGITSVGVESIGDIPSKTGLGSSSAYAVGLHHALSAYKGMRNITPAALAESACATEIEKLKEPIGKQDQYAAAFGGLRFYRFNKDGTVKVEKVIMDKAAKKKLEENLVFFYTGITRSASGILKEQRNSLLTNSSTVEATKKMVKVAYEMKEALESSDLVQFGKLLHKGWQIKRSLASTITNKIIDRYYELGLEAGALGGKLLGAGGGGFLLFYCEKEHQEKLRKALSNLKEVKMAFTDKGSEILIGK